MDHHKISKLFKSFETRNWIKANDLLGGQNLVNKNIRLKTPTLRSNFRGYVVMHMLWTKAKITTTGANNANRINTFNNNASSGL